MREFPKIILVFTMVDWPIFMRRKMVYALAEAAQKHNSVVIAVNRPLCKFSTIIKKPERVQEFFDKPKLEQLAENLYLFSPHYFIHDRISTHSKFLENLNLKYLRKAYLDLCGRLNIIEENPLIWFYHPIQNYVLDLFQNSFSVFEIKDNLSNFDGHENILTNRLEEKRRNQIDLLLTVTGSSLEKYGKYYSTAWMSGNGLDRAIYNKLIDPKLKPDKDIMQLNSPRIGYAGLISDRLDWELIENIVRQKPHWNFIFVGPISKSVPYEKINKYENIHFTGKVEHSRIPAILKTFNVGIMPYKDNEFFRFSNPLKFYEFAAAGVPMVSSNMEWLNNFSADFVRIVPHDPESWIKTIAEFAGKDKKQMTEIGQKIASQYIWENMADDLLNKIVTNFYRK